MIRLFAFVLLTLSAVSLAAGAAQPDPPNKPSTTSPRPLPPPPEGELRVLFDAKTDKIAGITNITVRLQDSTTEFRVEVAQRGAGAAAVNQQQLRTGWKSGFFFVRDDCLETDDAKRPFRCVVDHVFTFVEGAAVKRLVYLGEVFAGDDCVEEAKLGCALYEEFFTDIYDALEVNTVLSRNDSPAILIEMRAVNGQFEVELDETWGRNQERFIAGEKCLAAKGDAQLTACVDGITPRRAYFFNATLATYAQRREELTRTRAWARSAMCIGASDEECSETLRLSALLLQRVKSGERPRNHGKVTTNLMLRPSARAESLKQ
jgi:hypothetical protein